MELLSEDRRGSRRDAIRRHLHLSCSGKWARGRRFRGRKVKWRRQRFNRELGNPDLANLFSYFRELLIFLLFVVEHNEVLLLHVIAVRERFPVSLMTRPGLVRIKTNSRHPEK